MSTPPEQRTASQPEAGDLWTWLTAASGLIFIVLAVAGFILAGSDPTPADSFQTIRAYFVDNRSAVLASVYLDSLSLAFFLAFAAGLGGLFVRSAADPWGILSRLMLAGAIATTVITLVENMAEAAIAFHTAATGDTAAIQALFDFYMMVPLLSFSVATFLVAAAIGILRGSLIPRWLGWLALIPSALLVIGVAGIGDPRGSVASIGFFGGYLPFLVWTLVTSVCLIVRRQTSAAPARSRAVSSGSGQLQPGP